MAYYPMFRLHSATSGLHLHQLFIDESYRGQGCARQFMEYLTNTAAEFGASYITVSADLQNEPAHQVYLSMGFKRVAMGGAFFEYRQNQMAKIMDFMPICTPTSWQSILGYCPEEEDTDEEL